MSTPIHPSQIADLLPLYVLGALEPDEMLALDEIVQRDPELQARVRALEQAAAQLAYAAPDAPLPTGGKERLLARVAGDPQTHATQTQNASLAAKPATVPEQTMRGSRTPSPAPRNWFAGLNRWAIATGLALLAILLFGLNLLQLQTQVAQLQQEVTLLRVQNQQLEQQIRVAQSQLAFYTNVDRSVVMNGTALAPSARGVFYLRGSDGRAIVRGLTPLPNDRTYQLWLVPSGGAPTSVGLVPLQPDGTSTIEVAVPPALQNFAIVDVSIEPAGGSQNITKETIVLRGALQ